MSFCMTTAALTTSSSDEDDLDILLVEMAFAPKVNLGRRINLEDITDTGCEQMFR